MGYQLLNDVYTFVNYVRNARRESMTSPYGYAGKWVVRSVEKGNGLYMVVDFGASHCAFSYRFDSRPYYSYGFYGFRATCR